MTNQEILQMRAEPRIVKEKYHYCGIIEFSSSHWAGDGEIDFPVVFGMLGMVPIQVDTGDLVCGNVKVTYRWAGFPRVAERGVNIPEYSVRMTMALEVTPSGTRRVLNKLEFVGPTTVTALRVGDDWVINPVSEDFSVGDIVKQNSDAPANTKIISPRRIQVRPRDE